MIKKTVSLMMALLFGFSLSSCVADIDGHYRGYSNGFNYTGPRYEWIMHAVRSESDEFDIENVELDFYCGWFVTSFTPGASFTEDFPKVAFYIVTRDEDGQLGITLNETVLDYYRVKNFCLIAEVPAIEFISEAYEASQTTMSGKMFNHPGIKLTIPKEVFIKDQDSLPIYAAIITISEEDGLFDIDYTIAFDYHIYISYEKMSENRIKLL